MKHQRVLLSLLCIFLVLFDIFGSAFSDSFDAYRGGIIGQSFNGFNLAPPRRSLLSDSKEPKTALVASLDGAIYLLDLDSRKPLWSFASGPAIYSSYQAPSDHDKDNATGIRSDYYIDCGDDWELYAHNRLGKLRLMKTLEEYVSSTPQIGEDGGIVLGSKKTTAFLVDAKTGNLIHKYKLPDSPTIKQNSEESRTFEEQGLSRSSNLKADELPLYITRTDYTLTSFAPNSDKVLWNMTVAEIGAAFLCQEIENSYDGTLLDSGSTQLGFDMPLPCQSRALVYRFRNHDMLEPFSRPTGLPEAHNQEMILPASGSHDILPSQPNVGKILENYDNRTGNIPPLPLPSAVGNGGIFEMQEANMSASHGLSAVSTRVTILLMFFAMLVGMGTYHTLAKNSELFELFGNKTSSTVPSKKKKARKSGKSGSSAEQRDKDMLLDGEIASARNETHSNLWLNLNKQISSADGRRIGKLFVSSDEIAKGSNGTVVLEGFYEGRPVAVKRLVRAHHDIAFKEIQNLIASDRHPNIVRWYGVEQDQDFVYLSLERCICSLNDLIHMSSDCTENSAYSKSMDAGSMTDTRIHFDSLKSHLQDIKLWKANGHPSPVLIKLMRDVVSGLVHLHELGIIHRDLKPQNILIIKERSLRAKLSDMGISKRLLGDMSSLGQHATGYGSSGWQAPEQLLHGRQTRAVDLFSLGCVLFFCITGGRHPFGHRLERDINITKNQVDLFLVEHIPEAVDLFSLLLNPNAEMRPKAVDVLAHPLFWGSEMRLSFLCHASDRVELEDRETGSTLLKAIERTAPIVLGGKWDEKMEPAFIHNIGYYRRYRFDSVRDLLRVMRNKFNHYEELPTDIQELLGPVPEGFDDYFRSRFPKLLIEVYKVMRRYCREEERFLKYFISSVV